MNMQSVFKTTMPYSYIMTDVSSSTLVAFRSFILCFLDGYNKALCNDELYFVKGGPTLGSII